MVKLLSQLLCPFLCVLTFPFHWIYLCHRGQLQRQKAALSVFHLKNWSCSGLPKRTTKSSVLWGTQEWSPFLPGLGWATLCFQSWSHQLIRVLGKMGASLFVLFFWYLKKDAREWESANSYVHRKNSGLAADALDMAGGRSREPVWISLPNRLADRGLLFGEIKYPHQARRYIAVEIILHFFF